MNSYLIKYITADGRHTIVNESTDVFGLKGIRLGGVLFDETNIVTVSGVNSMASVSGALDAKIDSVSGVLDTKINSVSGASSIRDDLQDSRMQSVSGALQSQINAITNDTAKEETITVSGATQRTFAVAGFSFDPSDSIPDIQVDKNGLKMHISPTGVSSVADYHKVDAQTIVFHYDIPQGSKVTIRDERTGGGGGGGGGTDLDNIITNPAPMVNGGQSLGTSVKAWSSLILHDSVSGGNWALQVVGGVLQAVSL